MNPDNTQPTTPTQGSGNVQSIIANFKSANPSYASTTPSAGGTDWYSQVKAGAYAPATSTPQTSTPNPVTQPIVDAGKGLVSDTNAHAANIVQDLSSKPSFSGALDVAGNVAGEVGSIFGRTLQAVTPQPIKDALSQTAQSVAGTPAAKAVIDAWNKFQAQNPEQAKNIGNAVNIAALFGGGEATVGAPTVEELAQGAKEGVSNLATAGKDAVGSAVQGTKDLAGNAVEGAKNLVASKATLPDVVGKITQASPEELPAATRALKSVDLTGSKTFSDVSSKLDAAIKSNTAAVDTKLGASTDVLKPSDVEKTIPVKGGSPITTNPVNDAIKQLSDFYTKTNNPEELANIKTLEAKFSNEGLTPKEINDLARTHGQVLNAYNANGELASGLSRQAAENTRTALKTTARDAMPDSATQAIDKNTSDLIKTKGMVDDMSTKVQALENKLKSFTPLQKAGQFAGKAVNVATGGALKTFIKGLTGFGMDEGTTLNALQLQDSLGKNLKLLDKLNGMSPESAAKQITSLTATK